MLFVVDPGKVCSYLCFNVEQTKKFDGLYPACGSPLLHQLSWWDACIPLQSVLILPWVQLA